jgi:hypothetical protein
MAEPDYNDPFAPVKGGQRKMRCLHCGEIFVEEELQYEKRFGRTLWWCPTVGCDGAGVGFDIHSIEVEKNG